MSDSHGLAPVQGLRLMSRTQYPTSRSCLSPTGSSLRCLCGVGVYSRAMTTLPSMDGGGAPPEGRVGGVWGGSAAIVVRGWLVWQPARRRASSVLPPCLSSCPLLGSVSASELRNGPTLPVARHTSVDQPVTPSARRQSTEPSRFPQGPGDKERHPQRSPRPRTGSLTSLDYLGGAAVPGQPYQRHPRDLSQQGGAADTPRQGWPTRARSRR